MRQHEVVHWIKSSRSTSQGGTCVEVAAIAGTRAVRDSTDRRGGVLLVPYVAFEALKMAIRGGGLRG